MKTFRLALPFIGSILYYSALAAIPPDDFSLTNLYEQYAAAAYCPANSAPGAVAPNQKIVCKANNCPLVQAANTTILYKFPAGLSDIEGFIALDNTSKLIVVAFRGSDSISNVGLDLLSLAPPANPQDFPGTFNCGVGCQINPSFFLAYASYSSSIIQALSTAIAAHSTYKLVTVGHSLGGALAQYLAFQLRFNNQIKIDLATFGAPAAGTLNFAAIASNQAANPNNFGRTFRFVHKGDPVVFSPRQPPYTQPIPMYYINTTHGASVAASDVYILAQTQPPAATLSLQDHSFYYNSISACG